MSNMSRYSVDTDNTQTRCPLVVVLDVSGSMYGDPEKQVKNGVRALLDGLKNHDIAAYSVELVIIEYADYVSEVMPLKTAYEIDIENDVIDKISNADGCTSMGNALNFAIDVLQSMKNLYVKNGISHYIPHLVFMSDGEPTDNGFAEEVAEKLIDLETDKKLVSVPLAVDGADMHFMNKLSVNGATKIETSDIVGFFKFLSASMSSFASTGKTNLNQGNIQQQISDWGDI